LPTISCALCGCTITAERKKQPYVYYHCTGFKGRCGYTYVREEVLSQQFEEVVRRIQIPGEVADAIAETLRTSQADKERFHRTAVMQPQRYLSVQNKLDRAYDDRLGGNITDELWTRKSEEWQRELEEIRRETSRHEKASADYSVAGSRILELAKNANNLLIRRDRCNRRDC
jgi:site-specific DNA recombinase